MNQIPNIEETNTREVEEIVAQLLLRTYDRCFVRGRVPPEVGSSIAHYDLFLKEELTNLLHQQLQKAREDWLREEIEKLEGMKQEEPDEIDYDGTGLSQYGFNSALQTIIDRYHSELDQDKK